MYVCVCVCVLCMYVCSELLERGNLTLGPSLEIMIVYEHSKKLKKKNSIAKGGRLIPRETYEK